jgi:hypothetical protein
MVITVRIVEPKKKYGQPHAGHELSITVVRVGSTSSHVNNERA